MHILTQILDIDLSIGNSTISCIFHRTPLNMPFYLKIKTPQKEGCSACEWLLDHMEYPVHNNIHFSHTSVQVVPFSHVDKGS